MIEESLLKSNFIGKDGFVWWIGQIADPKVWRNENSRVDGKERESGTPIDKEAWGYRCKVRIIGYHSFSKNQLPDEDLPWAHILTSASDGAPGQGNFGKLPLLVGGESVLGFFLDGEEAQQPVVMSCFHRTPAVVNVLNPDPFQAFTGLKGNLSSKGAPTRNKQQSKGTISEPPTEIDTKAEIKSNQDLLKNSFNSDVDLGIGVIGGPNYSSIFNLDSTLNLGSTFGSPNIPSDILYFDDVAELAFLKNFDNKPVEGSNGCQDNIISQITTQIQSFISFINELEKTTLGFIDPIRNVVVDIQQTVRSIARLIASIVKIMINGIRDSIFKLIGKLFVVLGITIPSAIQLPISEAAKRILNIIFCIFEKLFGPMLDFIMGLLNGLIGKSTNVARCAAEETAASLISKLSSMLDEALSNVLGGLDWLASGIGSIAGAITGALNMISQLLSFLSCDALACKSTSTWDPFGGIELPKPDNWAKVLGDMNILKGLGDDADAITSLLSMFGSPSTPFKDCRKKSINPQSQDDIQRTPLGLKYYKCIPPEIVIYGDGVGATAIPIVSNSNGSLLTIKVTNPGKGYSYPPEIKIIEKTNFGKGAYAKATINQNGNIDSVYLIDPGIGYCLTNLIGIIDPGDGGGGTGIGTGGSGTDTGGDTGGGGTGIGTGGSGTDTGGDTGGGGGTGIGTGGSGTDTGGDTGGGGTGIGTGGSGTDTGGGGTGIGTTTVIGISTNAVGVTTNVVVVRPGLGYSSGDTINIGNCIYKPVLTSRGSIIAVTSPSSCKLKFNTLPSVTINTTTGEGAEVYPIIEYIPEFITDNPSALSGLSTSNILKVIQCVSTKSIPKHTPTSP